jgi:hypothetical protein
MHLQLTEIFRCLAALAAGGLIGYVFGTIQQIALRRNEKRQETGQLNSGWAVMPGSGRRVAYLLIALVLVQLICPLFFVNGSQWWVSGGVVLGYGTILYRQLRQRQAALKR